MYQRTPWGGGKRRGVENLTNDTPPKKGFWTPLVRYVFHPPHVSVLCFSCTKIHDRADQKLFWRGSEIFGRARSLVRFPPPIRFAPPHITAQLYSHSCEYRKIFSRSHSLLHISQILEGNYFGAYTCRACIRTRANTGKYSWGIIYVLVSCQGVLILPKLRISLAIPRKSPPFLRTSRTQIAARFRKFQK